MGRHAGFVLKKKKIEKKNHLNFETFYRKYCASDKWKYINYNE